ncbi:MAG: hypothetical protein DIZ77_16725 [endosymbiont of Seepiophila jonesi]|nr:MAG: hypothetical protein DIZ77_16725 [endosymbiont of Seepiophila jonesi]
MSQDPATLAFLPWLRRGISTGITAGSPDPGRAALDVTLAFNGDREVSAPIALYGPGEVAGINPRSIIRTYPQPEVHDAECNYFPLIEFDQPDFPWRYTPAAPVNNRLHPWLVLIALTDNEIVGAKAAGADGHLPWIQVASAGSLPQLTQSWAWAHVQITGLEENGDEEVADVVDQQPDRAPSRLLCPRHLQPHTAYTVCLVPAFNRGRLAGLGEAIGVDEVRYHSAQPSWWQGVTSVKLPVYYQWRFQTGAAGDFESLTRQLLPPKQLPAGVGRRQMDVSVPGPELPPAAEAPMALEGALISLTEPDSTETQDKVFNKSLHERLNVPTAMLDSGETRVVAPPLYGRWHAARDRIPSVDHPWFDTLNSDLRHRTMAGLGTRVVQKLQQELMAEAWDQVEGVLEINEQIRETQLAAAVTQRLHERHFETQDELTLLFITEPLHGQVQADRQTVRQTLRQNPPVRGLLEGQFRRISRPLGPIRTRQRRLPEPEETTSSIPSEGSTVSGESGLLMGLIEGERTFPRGGGKMRGSATLASVADHLQKPDTSDAATLILLQGLREGKLSEEIIMQAPVNPDFQPTEETPVPKEWAGTESEWTQELATRKRQEIAHIFGSIDAQSPSTPSTGEGPLPPEPLSREPLEIHLLRDTILAATDPAQTILLPLTKRLTTAEWVEWDPAKHPGEQLMVAPEIDRPMYEPLQELSQEWLLPGVSQIPPNTVSLLKTNRKFIESYMAGLNHEMARELLWHEYPTDQRGTCFRQFWDVSGYMGPQPAGGLKDIRPIHMWGKSELGGNACQQTTDGEQVVLLVRGELLRHYPNTIIYVQKAMLKDENGPSVAEGGIGDENPGEENKKSPLFFGRLAPDIFFAGFALSQQEARGDGESMDQEQQGWYFVLQEQPTEPHFGLDAAGEHFGTELEPPGNWRDLSWGHLVDNAEALQEMSNIDLDQLDSSLLPNEGQGAEWHAHNGSLGSDLALITLQAPLRALIHGSDMLPPEKEGS